MLRHLDLGGRELSVALVSDREMRVLNRRYRRRNRATDVLAFPADVPESWPAHELLGDVVISVDTARAQAAAAGIPLAHEAEKLLVHGLLHLLGYDHERSASAAARMRREEESLWRFLHPR